MLSLLKSPQGRYDPSFFLTMWRRLTHGDAAFWQTPACSSSAKTFLAISNLSGARRQNLDLRGRSHVLILWTAEWDDWSLFLALRSLENTSLNSSRTCLILEGMLFWRVAVWCRGRRRWFAMSTASLWAAKKSAPSMGTATLATTNSHLYLRPWIMKSILMHPSILRGWPSAVEMTGPMYCWR